MDSVNPNKQPIKFSTQDFVDIVDIADDMIVLKGGRVSLIIQTTAVNFDLLSEDEQDSRIHAFAGLLNSINYPLQIVIRTKKVDITSYLSFLRDYLKKPMSEGRRYTMQIYLQFIQNLIVKNDILDKKFYIIVSYGGAPTMPVLSPVDLIKGKKNKPTVEETEASRELLLERARNNLYPKRDHILRQLNKMGVQGIHLENEELLKVFYELYNN